MRYLFYLGHPAHFHLFKNLIAALRNEGCEIRILIKTKDILEDLLHQAGWSYDNVFEKNRGDSKVAIAWSLLLRDVAVWRIARDFRPHLMIGTSAEIAHVGKVLGISSIVINEDDHDVVPLFSKLAYPFATTILAPRCCRVGRWSSKTYRYDGYHELAYLHPNNFTPDCNRVRNLVESGEPYFILRFAKLTAHHDAGRKGLTAGIARDLIDVLRRHGRVFITSERLLEPEFERYRIKIDALDVHHALYYAAMYIGDSQTMAAEAAVLGTPSIRFNDFVGEISYLEELEHEYHLTYGIRANEPQSLLDRVSELLNNPNLRQDWQVRRQKMLEEKTDVAAFMTWFISNYPESAHVVREDAAHTLSCT